MATIVREDNITFTELDYLIDSERLHQWAAFSIPERCVMFKRQFPDRILRPWTLRLIMKKAGIKKKKILVRRAAQRAT